jgi:hypothetical protein
MYLQRVNGVRLKRKIIELIYNRHFDQFFVYKEKSAKIFTKIINLLFYYQRFIT